MRTSTSAYYSCLLSILVAGSTPLDAQSSGSMPSVATARDQRESRLFTIRASDASEALAAFSKQSGIPVVFAIEQVRGVRTNVVDGRFHPRQALDMLVAKTVLTVVEDARSGALIIRPAPASGAVMPPGKSAASDSEALPKTPRRFGILSALVAAISAPLLPGQTVAPEEQADKTITLSAFEIRTDRDVGYTATSSLAGGRIDSPLKETPSAISVLTAEFLEDIGATSFASAAEWAPNAIPVPDTTNPTAEYNVNLRGVGNSFPTRNYFRWYVSSDSYNTERLEFARGPNSILFGDGNPGGINTTWTKQALFVPRRSIQLRTDSFGGYRASFDYNLPASEKFAVRLNAVADRLKGWRDYDEPRRNSAHLATTFRFTRETQFRSEFEQGHYRRFSYNTPFADQSSNWDRTTTYDNVTPPSTVGTGVARYNAGAADDYLVLDPNRPAQGVLNWRGFYQTTGTGLRLHPDPRPIERFPLLPSREFSLQPPDAYVDTNYRTWTFYLEHRLHSDLIAQLAFNHQDQERPGNVSSYDQHRIDVNTVLPNGTANPNFGKAFVDVQPQRILQENTLSDWRLSLAYKKQLRWLRQSVSVVSGLRTDEYNSYTSTAGRVNNTNPNSQAATNAIRIRQYWDAPRNPAGFVSLLSNGYDIKFINTATSDEDQSLQYNQIASASALLDGRLSVLLGYRYDTHDRKQQRRVAAAPDGSSILGATDGPGTLDLSKISVGTSSAGAVFFPAPWIGVYANYSESFNAPGSGAAKIDGTAIGPASNEGVDFGLKLEFFGGKLSGTIGHYRMRQIERPRAGDATADINEIWSDLGRTENAILAYRDTESYKASGYELDITANLTRSWRLMFNYAIPRTEQADIGAGLRGYVATHLATWQAGADNPALPNAARIRQNITDINNVIAGYTQGRTLNNTVKFTSNVYSTYSFREGFLKGFAFGGGANFRGKQVIGNLNNSPFDYLYARAYTLVSSHASYDWRIGKKIRTRLQLNVSNLLNEDDIVFMNYAFNVAAGGNVPQLFRYQTPRRYSLSATVNF